MSRAESTTESRNEVQQTNGGSLTQNRVPPLYRSRTDSVIVYTPPCIGEAVGSTFYIKKNGHIDYYVLLKVNYPTTSIEAATAGRRPLSINFPWSKVPLLNTIDHFKKKDYFCEMKTLFRTKVCGVRYGHKKHSWDPICMKCEHISAQKKATAIQLLFSQKKAIFAWKWHSR